MGMTLRFEPNTRVRRVGDPTCVGLTTNQPPKPSGNGGPERYQVLFLDRTCWVSADLIEKVPLERESPVDLVESGRWGRAQDLRRMLTHARLSGKLADVIYSMETTNADFYAYQFKPVLRFLESPNNALLIADEVGLGKTIEAGLIWTELRTREDLRRLLVLCPAMLREKWQRELESKLGVRAEIADAAMLLKRLAHPERAGSQDGFAFICSFSGTRPEKGWDKPQGSAARRPRTTELAKLLDSNDSDNPLFDLVVIDEAHYLRNPKSQTNRLGQLIRGVCSHFLMLTATPIHNYNRDLFSLLNLLDESTFRDPSDLTHILEASRPLVCARDALLSGKPAGEVLRHFAQAEQHPLLSGNRQLASLREALSEPAPLNTPDLRAAAAMRIEHMNPHAYAITRTRKRDVKEWRVVREPVSEAVEMSEPERACYEAVTAAVIDYAMTEGGHDAFLLATPQRQLSSSMAATLGDWKQRRDNVDDTRAAQRGKVEEPGPLVRSLMDRLEEFGDEAVLAAHDTKFERVNEMVQGFFADFPTEKIVLFSTFRGTLRYLHDRFKEACIPTLVMHGDMKKSKDEILDQFREDCNIRLLLSSEIGSEGIDLQFCRVVINYDLPWNPMRVEQRIGRLDRIGQKASKISIWNLFHDDTIDARIQRRLYEKLDLCRQSLGDFEDILGDEDFEDILGGEMKRLTRDLLSDHLTPAQQAARIDQSHQALANVKHDEQRLEDEAAHLVAYGDYILNQIHGARDKHRWITGTDLRSYVLDYLKQHYTGCEYQRLDDDSEDYNIRLSPKAIHELDEFIRSNRLGRDTRLLRPGSAPVRVRFERNVASRDRSVETISQFHPLVRMINAGIAEREEQLMPAVSVRIPVGTPHHGHPDSGVYLLAGARWTAAGLKTVERLEFAAMRIQPRGDDLSSSEAEALAFSAAEHGIDWFEGPSQFAASELASLLDERLYAGLETRFREFASDMQHRNEDRADLQSRNLDRHLNTKRDRLEEIRRNHTYAGRNSLANATEGRIKMLESRVDQQRLRIEERRHTRVRTDEVIAAIIMIE